MKKLYIFYDPYCGLCTWARHWMFHQPAFLALEFIAASSSEAAARFPSLQASAQSEELIVVDDEGGVYRDGDAWIMCLYALREYREWSFRLARPTLIPLARTAFHLLSKNRFALSGLLQLRADEPLVSRLEASSKPLCASHEPASKFSGVNS